MEIDSDAFCSCELGWFSEGTTFSLSNRRPDAQSQHMLQETTTESWERLHPADKVTGPHKTWSLGHATESSAHVLKAR